MADWGGSAKGAAAGAATGAQLGSFIPGLGTGIGAGIGAGVGFLGGLFGGRRRDRAVVPGDIARLRQQNIDMLMRFLQGGAFDAGGAGNDFFFGSGPNRVNDFLSAPSPEMQAFATAKPILEGMLTGTGPQFERDISMANATGGRFGSANAIMRGEALRNLFNARTQTASTLGALANQAGSSQFDRLMGVQNQRLQLLAGLLGMSGQASLALPVQSGDDGGGWGDIFKLVATLGNNKIPQGGTTTGKTPTSTPTTIRRGVPVQNDTSWWMRGRDA